MGERRKRGVQWVGFDDSLVDYYQPYFKDTGEPAGDPFPVDWYTANDKTKKSGWFAWYSQYLQSPAWKNLRQRVLRRDRKTCQHCGDPATVVHHKTYKRAGRELLSDLISLCDLCHEVEHEYLEKRRAENRCNRWW